MTTNLVIAEVHRLLLHRAGIAAASAAIERLDSSPALTIVFPDAPRHRDAREWISRLKDPLITYTDAVSFAVMKSSRCDAALSFDHDFDLAGFSVWRG